MPNCTPNFLVLDLSHREVVAYANSRIKLKLRLNLANKLQTILVIARCVFVLGLLGVGVHTSVFVRVCMCVRIVIEIASRCEMKRKVIESIEMKIKLNACAHTFIHTRTHTLIHSLTERAFNTSIVVHIHTVPFAFTYINSILIKHRHAY